MRFSLHRTTAPLVRSRHLLKTKLVQAPPSGYFVKLHCPSIAFQLSTIIIASGLVLNASFIPWLQKHRKACFFTMGYGYAAPERGWFHP